MTTAVETYLNSLPEDILTIDISCSRLKSFPDLTRFKNLQELHCYNNKLTSLPDLTRFKNLKKLHCSNNQLTVLPTLPQKLETLYCSHNQLNLLPTLPQNLEKFNCVNNPIYEIVSNNSLFQIKQNIQILNNFRHLWYCLQYKKQFRKWLWEKVREPKIKKIFHPINLIKNLGEDDDLDEVLKNWIENNK
jgi:Leucine-rich repeat (LRR) protein